MERPEYVGYAACAVVAINVASPALLWCTTTLSVSYGCSWLAAAA